MAFLDETGLAEVWSLANQKFAKSEVVSYTGTGTMGSSNPCSITFSFVPKVVIWIGSGSTFGNIRPGDYYPKWLELISEWPTSYTKNVGFLYGTMASNTYPYGKKSADGKTLSWYSNYDVSSQLNTSGNKYWFLAIG